MTRRPPTGRRPGLGLTEVLVALFIMALGMISLLTLFPVGAMSIAHGLKDDRCSETALQADGFMRAYWQSQVVEGTAESGNLMLALTTNTATTPTSLGSTQEVRSFPAVIDSIGFISSVTGTSVQTKVAGDTAPTTVHLPRCKLASIAAGDLPAAIKTSSLVDDWTFEKNGAPETTGPTRQGRYYSAALIQLPSVAKPTVAEFKVLVFDGRPPGVPLDKFEVTQSVSMTKDSRATPTLTLPAPPEGVPAYARRGGWFMDGTLSATERRADFYRITGVSDTGALDFDPPFRGATGTATLYFFAGLAEVFDRPPLAPAAPK